MRKLIATLSGIVLAVGLVVNGWAGPAAPGKAPATNHRPSVGTPQTGKAKEKTKAEKLGKQKVNLNKARQKTLEKLPGIGPARAKQIIAERKKKPFTSLDELVSRKILSAKDLDKIRDNLTVQ